MISSKNKKVHVYLTGAITGNPKHREQFKNAERMLKANCKNIKVINPLKINNKKNTYNECMKKDIKALMNCHCILTVNNYYKSKGSSLEIKIAQAFGMLVFRERTSIDDFTSYMRMKNGKVV